jgi:hypothetical protein
VKVCAPGSGWPALADRIIGVAKDLYARGLLTAAPRDPFGEDGEASEDADGWRREIPPQIPSGE